MNAESVKQEILSWLPHVPEGWTCSPGERGVVIGLMNNALRLDGKYKLANARRHTVLAYLFRETLGCPSASEVSSKQMTDACWYALGEWSQVYNEDKTWKARGDFAEAMVECWLAMVKWEESMRALVGGEL